MAKGGHLLLLALCLLVSACAALPVIEGRGLEDAAATPTGDKKDKNWTLWGTAKHFFDARQKIKAKSANGSTGSTETPPMPTQFGVGYKHVVAWYCAKAENKEKKLCSVTPKSPGGAGDTAKGTGPKPTTAESREVYKLYCAEPAHKPLPFCTMVSLSKKPPPPPVVTTAKSKGKGKGKGAGKRLAEKRAK